RRESNALQVDSQLLARWIDVETQSARQSRHHPEFPSALLELELGQLTAEVHFDRRRVFAATSDPGADDGTVAAGRRALVAGVRRGGGVPLVRACELGLVVLRARRAAQDLGQGRRRIGGFI